MRTIVFVTCTRSFYNRTQDQERRRPKKCHKSWISLKGIKKLKAGYGLLRLKLYQLSLNNRKCYYLQNKTRFRASLGLQIYSVFT